MNGDIKKAFSLMNYEELKNAVCIFQTYSEAEILLMNKNDLIDALMKQTKLCKKPQFPFSNSWSSNIPGVDNSYCLPPQNESETEQNEKNMKNEKDAKDEKDEKNLIKKIPFVQLETDSQSSNRTPLSKLSLEQPNLLSIAVALKTGNNNNIIDNTKNKKNNKIDKITNNNSDFLKNPLPVDPQTSSIVREALLSASIAKIVKNVKTYEEESEQFKRIILSVIRDKITEITNYIKKEIILTPDKKLTIWSQRKKEYCIWLKGFIKDFWTDHCKVKIEEDQKDEDKEKDIKNNKKKKIITEPIQLIGTGKIDQLNYTKQTIDIISKQMLQGLDLVTKLQVNDIPTPLLTTPKKLKMEAEICQKNMEYNNLYLYIMKDATKISDELCDIMLKNAKDQVEKSKFFNKGCKKNMVRLFEEYHAKFINVKKLFLINNENIVDQTDHDDDMNLNMVVKPRKKYNVKSKSKQKVMAKKRGPKKKNNDSDQDDDENGENEKNKKKQKQKISTSKSKSKLKKNVKSESESSSSYSANDNENESGSESDDDKLKVSKKTNKKDSSMKNTTNKKRKRNENDSDTENDEDNDKMIKRGTKSNYDDDNIQNKKRRQSDNENNMNANKKKKKIVIDNGGSSISEDSSSPSNSSDDT